MTKISIFMAHCLVLIDDVTKPTSVRLVRRFIKAAVNVHLRQILDIATKCNSNFWKAQLSLTFHKCNRAEVSRDADLSQI